MFHIMGSPRSGTTLLAQCLSAHPDVVIPDETDLVVPAAFIVNRVRDPELGKRLIVDLILNSERFSHSVGEFLSRESVAECLARSEYSLPTMLKDLYDRLAKRAGKRIAGDKSPNDLLSTRVLVQTGVVGPSSKIIHIVRDIRDLMVSLNQTGWGDDFDRFFPRMWSERNLYLNYEMERYPASYLLLKYEDFVRYPEESLERISRFLGLEYCPEMLAPERRDSRYVGVAHHRNLYKSVNCDGIGQYKRHVTPETLEEYHRQAQEALVFFGYLGTNEFTCAINSK